MSTAILVALAAQIGSGKLMDICKAWMQEEQEQELISFFGPALSVYVDSSSDDDSASLLQGKQKKESRSFAKLKEFLKPGTPIYVESLGDRWDGAITSEGFLMDGICYKSPTALCKAHAERITDAHPKATAPGSGWKHVRIASNGKSIGEMYDAHYSIA